MATATTTGITSMRTRGDNITTMRTSDGDTKTSYVTRRTHVGRNGDEKDDDDDNDQEQEDAKEVSLVLISSRNNISEIQHRDRCAGLCLQATHVQDACPECMCTGTTF